MKLNLATPLIAIIAAFTFVAQGQEPPPAKKSFPIDILDWNLTQHPSINHAKNPDSAIQQAVRDAFDEQKGYTLAPGKATDRVVMFYRIDRPIDPAITEFDVQLYMIGLSKSGSAPTTILLLDTPFMSGRVNGKAEAVRYLLSLINLNYHERSATAFQMWSEAGFSFDKLLLKGLPPKAK